MDIRGYLRDMDHEEEELRTQIMRLQIRIQQLNDARLVLMQREEERAQHLGHSSPFGSLDGGQIVVRDRAKMMPPEKTSAASLPKPEPKREPVIYRARHTRSAYGVRAVTALLSKHGPMTGDDIRAALAGEEDADLRKRVTKALSNMRQNRLLTLDDETGLLALAKRRKPGKADPERAARDREQVLAVLAGANEPVPSGDVIAAIMGPERKNKARRDRLYWALKALRDSGQVHFREGLYRLPDKAA